jgi:hypothetical protein
MTFSVFCTDAVAGAHGRNAEEFIYRELSCRDTKPPCGGQRVKGGRVYRQLK